LQHKKAEVTSSSLRNGQSVSQQYKALKVVESGQSANTRLAKDRNSS